MDLDSQQVLLSLVIDLLYMLTSLLLISEFIIAV